MERLWPWIHVLCILVLTDLWTLPISKEQWPRPKNMELAEYLRMFYHMSHSSGPLPCSKRATSTSALEEKIREMQGFFSLKKTGRLDLQTLSLLWKTTRCSIGFKSGLWLGHSRTFRDLIAQYTPDLTREVVDTSFRLALKIWSDEAPLKFINVNHDKADIILSFARKTHGNFFPFDGPTGILAHAFKPRECMGGDVHFDKDEIWTVWRRYNLFTVVAHESGHSLGISHSKDPSSLMYPNYKYYNGAQYTLLCFYFQGKPVRKQDPPNLPKKCDPNFSVDAVAVFGKKIVLFKNCLFPSRYMWLRTTWTTYWNRLREGPSSTYLPSINSPVGAAYDIPAKGVAYVFTGNVQSDRLKVRNIDAAVHISEYGKTLFFIGHNYYRYDEHRRSSDWPGIGRRVDAAFELHLPPCTIYLFSGTKAYNYDYRQNRELSRILANAWLGC
uniref:Matrix metallopeptidase 20a (enamelysin) n=1 Tax=Salmo trutta TaxID=8032 RepID=A0A674EMG9_SALTR